MGKMEEGKERERKKKEFYFSLQLLGHTLSLMEIRAGPVGRRWRRNHGCVLLTGLLIMAYSVHFYHPEAEVKE